MSNLQKLENALCNKEELAKIFQTPNKDQLYLIILEKHRVHTSKLSIVQ